MNRHVYSGHFQSSLEAITLQHDICVDSSMQQKFKHAYITHLIKNIYNIFFSFMIVTMLKNMIPKFQVKDHGWISRWFLVHIVHVKDY